MHFRDHAFCDIFLQKYAVYPIHGTQHLFFSETESGKQRILAKVVSFCRFISFFTCSDFLFRFTHHYLILSAMY